MKARLVSVSKPVGDDFLHLDNAQDLVAFCARVSNPSNQHNTETSDRLVQYLIQHRHWSPLEMVSACVEIETTRDIARQLLRHRSFSFQEFSQRYANPTKDLDWVLREARLQDPKNRQNSLPNENLDLEHQWKIHQMNVISAARAAYTWAIENGVAKEQARVVLPEGIMGSRLYVNGTLRSWVHYIELRSAEGTQLEHRELAWACADAIRQIFPLIQDFTAKGN